VSNILFLDIDGVLLPFGSYNWELHKVFEKPHRYLERMVKRSVGVENIKKFCDDNDAQIVLISTWRYLFPAAFLMQFLDKLGLHEYLHETHWLATDPEHNYRDKSWDIEKWLRWQDFRGMWWIIDDTDVGVPHEHWIPTDPYRGAIDIFETYTRLRNERAEEPR